MPTCSLRLALALSFLAAAVSAAPLAAPPPAPPTVTLAPLPAGGDLSAFVARPGDVFVPGGVYDLKDPLRLDGWQNRCLMGAGRLDFGTRLQFGPLTNFQLRNCSGVTIANMSISCQPGPDGAGIVITGEQPCEIRFLNCMFGVSGNQPGAAVAVRSAGKVLFQGCHFFGGNPGLLIDHPQAEVTIVGGNFQAETVHIRQRAGWLQAYTIGFQIATGGADVELNGPTPRPVIVAGCRTEGPKYLLRTPDSKEQIDAVVKACGGAVESPQPLVRYGAAGTLFVLGNNAAGGIEAPASSGTIYSLGNHFRAGPQRRAPYEIGPRHEAQRRGRPLLHHEARRRIPRAHRRRPGCRDPGQARLPGPRGADVPGPRG